MRKSEVLYFILGGFCAGLILGVGLSGVYNDYHATEVDASEAVCNHEDGSTLALAWNEETLKPSGVVCRVCRQKVLDVSEPLPPDQIEADRLKRISDDNVLRWNGENK